jgi:hypothetical protein
MSWLATTSLLHCWYASKPFSHQSKVSCDNFSLLIIHEQAGIKYWFALDLISKKFQAAIPIREQV